MSHLLDAPSIRRVSIAILIAFASFGCSHSHLSTHSDAAIDAEMDQLFEDRSRQEQEAMAELFKHAAETGVSYTQCEFEEASRSMTVVLVDKAGAVWRRVVIYLREDATPKRNFKAFGFDHDYDGAGLSARSSRRGLQSAASFFIKVGTWRVSGLVVGIEGSSFGPDYYYHLYIVKAVRWNHDAEWPLEGGMKLRVTFSKLNLIP